MKKQAWQMTGMFMAMMGALTLASAQQGRQRPQGAQGGGGRGEMITKYDTNGDGKLTGDELKQMKADRDAMGAKQGARKGSGAPGGKRPSREKMMMNRFDADKSGSLDLEECAAMLKALDERTGGRPGESTGDRVGSRSDSRGRGAPEGAASREEMMKKFDTNGDGELDDTERAALRAKMGDRKRPGGRKPKAK